MDFKDDINFVKKKEYCPDDYYFTDIKPEEIEEQVESDA